MPSIEFPLLQKFTPFGIISDPRIPVSILTPLGDLRRAFLIDTGADFSWAPRGLAEQVGLDWQGLSEAGVGGIGAGRIRARLGPLPLQLGGSQLTVRCLFPEAPSALFILGRADFLDRFALTIDTRAQRVVLTELL